MVYCIFCSSLLAPTDGIDDDDKNSSFFFPSPLRQPSFLNASITHPNVPFGRDQSMSSSFYQRMAINALQNTSYMSFQPNCNHNRLVGNGNTYQQQQQPQQNGLIASVSLPLNRRNHPYPYGMYTESSLEEPPPKRPRMSESAYEKSFEWQNGSNVDSQQINLLKDIIHGGTMHMPYEVKQKAFQALESLVSSRTNSPLSSFSDSSLKEDDCMSDFMDLDVNCQIPWQPQQQQSYPQQQQQQQQQCGQEQSFDHHHYQQQQLQQQHYHQQPLYHHSKPQQHRTILF
eukprot:TRINITY_DN210_c1_g1_i3.p1 TRINITY_DN210_c1_g1~~TRINITY_DN210_c1_g1_i3.p1  ORF type:complete len:286 (+),score=95.32 TRINITY_DN210_c1_g1_i3:79-936(+)